MVLRGARFKMPGNRWEKEAALPKFTRNNYCGCRKDGTESVPWTNDDMKHPRTTYQVDFSTEVPKPLSQYRSYSLPPLRLRMNDNRYTFPYRQPIVGYIPPTCEHDCGEDPCRGKMGKVFVTHGAYMQPGWDQVVKARLEQKRYPALELRESTDPCCRHPSRPCGHSCEREYYRNPCMLRPNPLEPYCNARYNYNYDLRIPNS